MCHTGTSHIIKTKKASWILVLLALNSISIVILMSCSTPCHTVSFIQKLSRFPTRCIPMVESLHVKKIDCGTSRYLCLLPLWLVYRRCQPQIRLRFTSHHEPCCDAPHPVGNCFLPLGLVDWAYQPQVRFFQYSSLNRDLKMYIFHRVPLTIWLGRPGMATAGGSLFDISPWVVVLHSAFLFLWKILSR